MPDDYTSSWKAYIIAETVNGGTATDYASAPLEITVPRDIEAEKAKAEITRLIIGGFSALAALAALSLLLRKDKKYRQSAIISQCFVKPPPPTLGRRGDCVSKLQQTGKPWLVGYWNFQSGKGLL